MLNKVPEAIGISIFKKIAKKSMTSRMTEPSAKQPIPSSNLKL